MSLPPDQRGRRRQPGRIGGTPPAQLSHALGPKGTRQRRDGERRMETERRLREDAARFAEEFPELDEEAALSRIMARVQESP